MTEYLGEIKTEFENTLSGALMGCRNEVENLVTYMPTSKLHDENKVFTDQTDTHIRITWHFLGVEWTKLLKMFGGNCDNFCNKYI